MPPLETLDPQHGYVPAPRHRIWRDRLLPRSVIPLHWLAWVLLLPARVLGIAARRRRRRLPVRVAIESGRIGWTQVFFEELSESASEYLGTEVVTKQVIDRDSPYLPQFRDNLRRDDPSHLVLDVRTPTQNWRSSLWQGLAVSARLLLSGRTAIVILTDVFYRRQRWQAACLTAHGGVVLTFADAATVAAIFPHRRIIGPMPMPISRKRRDWLASACEGEGEGEGGSGVSVRFVGHWYPPRSLLLADVAERLQLLGIELETHVGKDSSSDDYWKLLATADVIITTCMQGPDRPFMDWIWIQQLVHRHSEATAAGAALVSSRVEGSARFFEAGVDFLEYVSVADAVDAVVSLVRDPVLRSSIARAGRAKSYALIESQAFWVIADSALPRSPITGRGRGIR